MSEELSAEIQAIVESEQPKEVEQGVTPAKVTPEATEQPAEANDDQKDGAQSKTFTEAELKAQVDAEAAKIRSKYERKMEKQRIESETRAKVLSEQQQQQVKVNERPREEDFSDYGSFLEELADWKADEKISQRENEKIQADIQKSQQAEISRQSERRNVLMETGEAKYEDFEDVVNASKLRIAEPAYLAILESDISADLVYHLAKDPVEAERIASLSPYAQAKEIGKIEDKLSAKQPIKKSDAPKPISPVSGSKDFTKSYEDMTIAEIEADAIKRGARWT